MQSIDGTNKSPFRVIVVGAGIAGLTLSNALQRGGIDHVVLEKHKHVIYPSGASIGIWPHGSRLLEQLGCLESIKEACSEMTVFYNRDPAGKPILISKLFDEIVRRHGYQFLLLERQEFVRALYDGLPSREPIKTGCAAKRIVESQHSVRVFLEDGSYEDGDMVVGCDGVSSAVRQMMWDNANKKIPNTISTNEMKSLKTSYRCLVGLSPAISGFASGSMTIVHNDGFSFLLFTQPQLTFFFVFKKLEKTYHWPLFPEYTQQDIETEASSLAALPINDDLLFGDIWRKRLRGDLVNVEEGIFEHWHSGRTVLVGDAAHKIAPNMAFGGNSAMMSAATLANLIRAKLSSSPYGLSSHPSEQELCAVFQAYHDQRAPSVRGVSRFSTFMTRAHACENAAFKFVTKYCFPLASDTMMGGVFTEFIRKGVKLDYLPLVDALGGSVPWDDEICPQRRNKNAVLLLLGSTLAAAVWLLSRLYLV